MQRTVAPLLIHQHAVDEQFQVGSAEAEHHVVPGRRTDQRHRHAHLQHAGAGIRDDTVGGGPAFAEPNHRVGRPGAPAVLQQRARTGQPAGSSRFREQVVPGGGRPRFLPARVSERLGRAVGAREDGAAGVAGVVATEQGRVPAPGAVAQPHAKCHGLAPQAVGRQRAALDPEVAAGELRHDAVAAAGRATPRARRRSARHRAAPRLPPTARKQSRRRPRPCARQPARRPAALRRLCSSSCPPYSSLQPARIRSSGGSGAWRQPVRRAAILCITCGRRYAAATAARNLGPAVSRLIALSIGLAASQRPGGADPSECRPATPRTR